MFSKSKFKTVCECLCLCICICMCVCVCVQYILKYHVSLYSLEFSCYLPVIVVANFKSKWTSHHNVVYGAEVDQSYIHRWNPKQNWSSTIIYSSNHHLYVCVWVSVCVCVCVDIFIRYVRYNIQTCIAIQLTTYSMCI